MQSTICVTIFELAPIPDQVTSCDSHAECNKVKLCSASAAQFVTAVQSEHNICYLCRAKSVAEYQCRAQYVLQSLGSRPFPIGSHHATHMQNVTKWSSAVPLQYNQSTIYVTSEELNLLQSTKAEHNLCYNLWARAHSRSGHDSPCGGEASHPSHQDVKPDYILYIIRCA